MPFTISHAGFVLPFRRFVPSRVLYGLIIGSMAPDVPYFFRAFEVASFAHSMMGALLIALPIGLLGYLVVTICFRSLTVVFPDPHASFLATWKVDRLSGNTGLPLIVVAIFLGALTHQGIDAFAHETGAFVAMFPLLREEFFSVRGESVPLFRVLQYGGSLLGMAMILTDYLEAFRRYCQRQGERCWQEPRKWALLLMLTLGTMIAAAFLQISLVPRHFEFSAIRGFGFFFLITWIPLMGGAFVCLALFLAWGRRHRVREKNVKNSDGAV